MNYKLARAIGIMYMIGWRLAECRCCWVAPWDDPRSAGYVPWDEDVAMDHAIEQFESLIVVRLWR